VLGLPEAITACLFDMDGVITQTAKVHDAAWKEMFDAFLRDWSASHDQPFVPFDPVADSSSTSTGSRALRARRPSSSPAGSSYRWGRSLTPRERPRSGA